MPCSRGGKVGNGGTGGTGRAEEGRDEKKGASSSLVDDVMGKFGGEFYAHPKCPEEVFRITGFDFVTDRGWFFKAAIHDRGTGAVKTEENCVMAAREYVKVPLRDYAPWMRELRATSS